MKHPLLFFAMAAMLFACNGTGQRHRLSQTGSITPERILEDLRSPRVKDVVIDSDTYNEMDDQYAIAYAIASDKMKVLSLHAAPFHNDRSSSFAEGMALRFKEMERILEVTG